MGQATELLPIQHSLPIMQQDYLAGGYLQNYSDSAPQTSTYPTNYVYQSVNQSVNQPHSNMYTSGAPATYSLQPSTLPPTPHFYGSLAPSFMIPAMPPPRHQDMIQPNVYQPAQQPQQTPVVGSQGVRGPLPTTTGSPSPLPPDVDPIKLGPNKWGCPACEKTFKHAKHVKRHYLRRMLFSLSRT
jgi:hypothetical protein